MQERATYSNGETGHPEIEALAALLDGMLPAEEAASLRTHLARCEPCVALLAETANFLRVDLEAEDADEEEEEEDVFEQTAAEAAPLPFEPRVETPIARPRPRRWAALVAAAASVAAALALATTVYHRQLGPPQVEIARLLMSLAGRQAAIAGSYWGPNQRGASVGPDDHALTSLRLGVELVNLDVSVAVADRDHAEIAAAHINGLLKQATADLATKQFFQGLPARILAGEPLGPLGVEIQTRRRDVEAFLQPLDYDLGRWAEAGHLAAAAARPEFLQAPDTRRFPATFRRQVKHDLSLKARAALGAIETILDKSDLTPADYKTLDTRFQEILETYYPV